MSKRSTGVSDKTDTANVSLATQPTSSGWKITVTRHLPTRRQRWSESLFHTPTPILLQNFRIRVQQSFKFENPTLVQTAATNINSTLIYPCLYLENDHTDSCYCRNWKVTPGPKEKRRIRPESTPVIRIRSHLYQASSTVMP